MVAALRGGVELAVGIDHPQYNQALQPVRAAIRTSLLADLS